MPTRTKTGGYAVPDAPLAQADYGDSVFSVRDVPILIAAADHPARSSASCDQELVAAHLNAAVDFFNLWDQPISSPGKCETSAIQVRKTIEACLALFDAVGSGGRFDQAAAIIRVQAAPLLEAGLKPSDSRSLQGLTTKMKELAAEMQIVASAYGTQKTGRKSSSPAESEFYKHLREAFLAAVGTEPKISTNPTTNLRTGPAVRFTRAVVGRMMRRMHRADLKMLGDPERIARAFSRFRGTSLSKK